MWEQDKRMASRQRRLARDFESEKAKERRELVLRREEYKRTQLLEHIKETDKRSTSLQKQRVGLKRLRQELRKNSDYSKYQARRELEKVAHKFNVTPCMEFPVGREQPAGPHDEDARAGRPWSGVADGQWSCR